MLLASEAKDLARSINNAEADSAQWLDYIDDTINNAANDGHFSATFDLLGLELPGFDYRVDHVQSALRVLGYTCRVYGMEEENIGEAPRLVVGWL